MDNNTESVPYLACINSWIEEASEEDKKEIQNVFVETPKQEPVYELENTVSCTLL